VVTGGARGIGQACAVRLAAKGYDVAIADLIEPTETARAVRSAGVRALPVLCDVAVPSDVTKTMKAVTDEFGRCDVLVNNAGVFPRVMSNELDLELWRRVLDVNLTRALEPAGSAASVWPGGRSSRNYFFTAVGAKRSRVVIPAN
jgi:NAD(P)-dependent dehydrogenase (short-subunit alcohol dehydrogenase family)